MFPIPWNFPFRKKDGSIGKIEDLGGQYTLPTASASTKGGIKVGNRLTMTGDVLSADAQIPTYSSEEAGKALKVDENGDLIWDTAGSGGGEDGIYAGLSDPDASLGEDGNFYLKCEKITGHPLIAPLFSGTYVIASGAIQNYESWKAFDRNSLTAWMNNNYTDQYIGVFLGSPGYNATKASIEIPKDNGNNRIKNFKIQASNDNSTWSDLYTGEANNSDSRISVVFDNESSYLYYRLFIIDTWNNVNAGCTEFQLYNGDLTKVSDIVILSKFTKGSGSWVAM